MGALKITGQSAEPTVTASDAGTLYYDSDTNKLRHYNGTAWADVSPAAAFTSNVGFMAYSAASWVDLDDELVEGTLVRAEVLFPLERYDNGSNYNTSTSRFTAPADGLYYFGAYIHTSDDDDSNSFGFLKNGAENTSFTGSNAQGYGNTHSNDSSQHKQAFSAMFYLTSGNEVSVGSFDSSDYYGINSWWMGCRVF